MHKLIEYICGELEELERKADKDGQLSMAEIQYGDTLAHFKKNLLKADEIWENSEYSMDEGSYARGGNRGGGNRSNRSGRSYARGGGRSSRSYSMGRYSREDGYSMAGEDMIDELRQLMQDAPDEQTRMEFKKFIQKMERMQ